MRRLVYGLMLTLLMALGPMAMAQVVGVGVNEQPLTTKEKAEAASKAALEKVFKYAQVRNYEGLGRMTVYTGREPNRALKSKLNLQDSFERVENENTCNLLHKILDKSVIWNATNFKVVNSVTDKFYYWDVEFTDEKTKTTVWTVLFVELGGDMLFARIDKKGVVKTN